MTEFMGAVVLVMPEEALQIQNVHTSVHVTSFWQGLGKLFVTF